MDEKSNIFIDVAEDIRKVIEQQKNKYKYNNVRQQIADKKHIDLLKDVENAQKLLADVRYPILQKILQEMINTLEEQRDTILSGQGSRLQALIFGKDYSRQEKIDRASILTAQLLVLRYLLKEPEEVMKLIESKKVKQENIDATV